jgi:hypothetical protein
MLAPYFVGRQHGVRFLQDLHDLAFCKSRSLSANLPAKACQKVLLPACLVQWEAYVINVRSAVTLVAGIDGHTFRVSNANSACAAGNVYMTGETGRCQVSCKSGL